MAVKTDGELKAFFELGDKPTQSQFSDLIDSKRSVLDKILWSDLHNDLQTLINNISTSVIGRPQRIEVTGDTSITMLAEYKLVGIAIKNPSAYALRFYVDFITVGPVGDPFIDIEVPAGGTVDVEVSKTFWVDTTLNITEQTGADFSGTPVIFLIDRK